MAYALLAHTIKEGSATTVTTTALDTTGATLIVLVCGFNQNATPPSNGSFSLTDSQGNMWSAGFNPNIGKTQNNTRTTMIAWRANPATNASHTFTLTGVGSFDPTVAVLAFSGAVGFPEKLVGAIGATVTSLSPGSITPSQNNELLIAGLCLPSTSTATIDASFSITDQTGGTTGQFVAAAYLIQTTAGAATPTWSFASNSGAASLMAFRLAASSGASGGAWAFA